MPIADRPIRGRRDEQAVAGCRRDLEQVADATGDRGLDDVRRADEARDETGDRPFVDVFGAADLLDLALRHHGEAVAHHERLFLVVGHVHERDADLALDAHQLELHLLAELEVERAERLVEQEHRGLVHQRAGQRDPLLLAARQLRRAAVVVAGELHEVEVALHPVLDVALRRPSCACSPNATLSATVRCGNSAYDWNTVLTLRLNGGTPDDVAAGELDPARVGLLEARRSSAARWSCRNPTDRAARRTRPR